ncbi:hypothetical protein DL89DRAFT_14327 [Linderina pennispora]|uniref:Uncharacterized protein n=1 Tax=Linderina pennispora TaxID=61395 RepID=A0A1Y1WLB0_9FUNG|nr:uncharacterized protein DL89DRAFT_14327 [Linderina pennispora]ORX74350.1 hypothetical protein DL89DRAFT_14327 [Linderina pennispora]
MPRKCGESSMACRNGNGESAIWKYGAGATADPLSVILGNCMAGWSSARGSTAATAYRSGWLHAFGLGRRQFIAVFLLRRQDLIVIAVDDINAKRPPELLDPEHVKRHFQILQLLHVIRARQHSGGLSAKVRNQMLLMHARRPGHMLGEKRLLVVRDIQRNGLLHESADRGEEHALVAAECAAGGRSLAVPLVELHSSLPVWLQLAVHLAVHEKVAHDARWCPESPVCPSLHLGFLLIEHHNSAVVDLRLFDFSEPTSDAWQDVSPTCFKDGQRVACAGNLQPGNCDTRTLPADDHIGHVARHVGVWGPMV